MTLYEILGVAPDASEDEIKAAYRKLAMQHHPDRGGDAEEFKKAKLAYEVLRDAARRSRYDETGEVEEEDGPEDEVLRAISTLLFQILEADNRPVGLDIVDAMRRVIMAKKEKSNDAIYACNKSITRLQRELKRFKRRGEGQNLLASLINARIEYAKEEINTIRAAQELHTKTLLVLADYVYEQDEDPVLKIGRVNLQLP